MARIPADLGVEFLHGRRGAFEHLHEEVVAVAEQARDLVLLVIGPRFF
ncbi:hypothetical protein MUN86_28215 (plasmid) [Hymenobacter volaticus]|uniref:Uncharacterized protein n=1 Tax=Hymenobacter volaticus TaxID=2932254 RepID=A0ABY4GF64_9BACT|nr:hypothetical protein [Hymenobacter volaticus]UOQ69528.1 hypothetical protein MUN86_28215 [Hymenobacter volaticus]